MFHAWLLQPPRLTMPQLEQCTAEVQQPPSNISTLLDSGSVETEEVPSPAPRGSSTDPEPCNGMQGGRSSARRSASEQRRGDKRRPYDR